MKYPVSILSLGLMLPTAGMTADSAVGRVIDGTVQGAIEGGFTALEREAIHAWYGDREHRHSDDYRDRYRERDHDRDDGGHKGKKGKKDKKKGKTPPGLAKRDSLPPGLQRQYEKNGRLPPGLEGRVLPHSLHRSLPPREGYKRVIVDTDVLLVETATGVIRDILYDVVK